MISKDYVLNSYSDYVNIDDFAYELSKRLGLNSGGYRGWCVCDDLFFINTWLSECGCEDNYAFPVDWLDLTFDEIVLRWRAEKNKLPKDRVIIDGES